MKTGDCLKLLPRRAAGSVHLAVADPPFGINWPGYDVYDDSLKGPAFIEWCSLWLQELYRAMHRHGSLWVYINDENVSELDVAAKAIGFHKRSHVVHYYSFGVACQGNFSRSHTHLLYYVRTKSKFTFNADAVRVPSNRQLVYNDKRAKKGGKLPDNTWILTKEAMANCFGPDEDTWLVPRVAGTFKERQQRGTHAGKKRKQTTPQMPMEVLERIIASCSNPGDTVIDPFLGTGTTGAAAVKLGRNFWGCDVDSNCVRNSKRRIQRELS